MLALLLEGRGRQRDNQSHVSISRPLTTYRSGSNKGSVNTVSSAGEPGTESNPRTLVCPKPAVFWQEHLQRAGMFLAPLRSAAHIVSTTPPRPKSRGRAYR